MINWQVVEMICGGDLIIVLGRKSTLSKLQVWEIVKNDGEY